MKSDISTPSMSESEDRELQAMFSRMGEWEKRGYDVSRLEGLRNNPGELKSVFFDFLNNLHALESVEEELDSIDPGEFTNYAEVIRSKLKNPDMAEEAKYELAELKQKIERSKLGVDVSRSTERISAAMRRGFSLDSREDVLRDELRRIREEESAKIKHDEMDRIRKGEVEKIRKQERKRLISKERGKLRREARDREMFQKRIKKTIKAVEASKKKYKKCPGCGGKIEIKSDKRPLRVKCNDCKKECILRGDSENNFRRCKCGNVMGIPSSVRPLKITCNKCDHSYLLKDKTGKSKASGNEDIQIIDATSKPTPRPKPVQRISRKTEMEDLRRTQEDVLSRIGGGGQNGRGQVEMNNGLLEGTNYAKPDLPDIGTASADTEIPGEENGLKHCPGCGHPVAENFNVCGFCGHLIKSETPSTQGMQLPPTPEITIPEAKPEIKPLGFPGMEPAQVGTRHEMPDAMMKTPQPAMPTMSSFESPGPSGLPELSGDSLPNDVPPQPSNQTLPSSSSGHDPKFCPQCGGEMATGSKFCGGCGFTL